jgi:WD repeat-containing protein 19
MFSEMKTDAKATKQENTVSLNMGKKTIYLYNLNDRDNPIELAFQAKYGSITAYKWFGDGYMMLGFSEGWFVVISTRIQLNNLQLLIFNIK